MAVLRDEGMSIYPLKRAIIPAKSQALLATGIKLTILKEIVASITSIDNHSPCEPLISLGILDPAYLEELTLLMENLTNTPLVVNPKLPIAYVHLLDVKDIVSYGLCGPMCNLGLSNPPICAIMPLIDSDLPPADHAKALALLKEYADLFSSGPQNLGF